MVTGSLTCNTYMSKRERHTHNTQHLLMLLQGCHQVKKLKTRCKGLQVWFKSWENGSMYLSYTWSAIMCAQAAYTANQDETRDDLEGSRCYKSHQEHVVPFEEAECRQWQAAASMCFVEPSKNLWESQTYDYTLSHVQCDHMVTQFPGGKQGEWQ